MRKCYKQDNSVDEELSEQKAVRESVWDVAPINFVLSPSKLSAGIQEMPKVVSSLKWKDSNFKSFIVKC